MIKHSHEIQNRSGQMLWNHRCDDVGGVVDDPKNAGDGVHEEEYDLVVVVAWVHTCVERHRDHGWPRGNTCDLFDGVVPIVADLSKFWCVPESVRALDVSLRLYSNWCFDVLVRQASE